MHRNRYVALHLHRIEDFGGFPTDRHAICKHKINPFPAFNLLHVGLPFYKNNVVKKFNRNGCSLLESTHKRKGNIDVVKKMNGGNATQQIGEAET